MSYKSIKTVPLVVLLFSLIIPAAFASKLAPLEINKLEQNSALIIIGKVEKISLLPKDTDGAKNYEAKLKIISYLKGKSENKSITLPLRSRGLKGFNIIPKENTYWIFFLKSVNKQKGKLVHPSAMLQFTRPCIEK